MIDLSNYNYNRGIYAPILKKRGFCPNPVAGNIPIWADGRSNPKIIGTRAWSEFWLEQVDRCVNGYTTAGIRIPPRYYFFLNFVVLSGLFGPQYPFFVDFDLEHAEIMEAVRTERKTGIMKLKARRKGISEEEQGETLHWGSRFIANYRALVGSGLDTYTKGLKFKFDRTATTFPDEMQLNELINNEKRIEMGFDIATITGDYKKEGFNGAIDWETFFQKAEKREGEYYHDIIIEEPGLTENLIEIFESLNQNLQFGGLTMGIFHLGGTSNKITAVSKGFYELWQSAESLNLVRMFIPGNRKHFPFYQNPKLKEVQINDPITQEVLNPIRNLDKYEKWQIMGCEDPDSALEHVMRQRVAYSKLKDKRLLKALLQDLPVNEKEAWSSAGNNNFDADILYNRLYNLSSGNPQYLPWVLEFVTNDAGIPVTPLKVTARPAKSTDRDIDCVNIYKHPRKDYRNLDVAGIDSYNQDQSLTSKSLGGINVVRNASKLSTSDPDYAPASYPVCLYYHRPPRKEKFYEIGLKIAVYYNLLRNVMISADNDLIMEHWRKLGGAAYIATRPRKFDAPNSTLTNNYGVKMTIYNKPLLVGLIQTNLVDSIDYQVFDYMLSELIAFDNDKQGTDWDIVDAYGYALMRLEDMSGKPVATGEKMINSYARDYEWVKDENGNMVVRSLKKEEKKELSKEGTVIDKGWFSDNYREREQKGLE